MSKPDEPLPSLDTLQRQIDEAKLQAGIGPKDTESDADTGMGQALQIGAELVAGVAVGSVAGYFLDRWLGTMPVFFIICFFLGAAAGFRNMVRQARKK